VKYSPQRLKPRSKGRSHAALRALRHPKTTSTSVFLQPFSGALLEARMAAGFSKWQAQAGLFQE